jgi:hypothetical protein
MSDIIPEALTEQERVNIFADPNLHKRVLRPTDRTLLEDEKESERAAVETTGRGFQHKDCAVGANSGRRRNRGFVGFDFFDVLGITVTVTARTNQIVEIHDPKFVSFMMHEKSLWLVLLQAMSWLSRGIVYGQGHIQERTECVPRRNKCNSAGVAKGESNVQ